MKTFIIQEKFVGYADITIEANTVCNSDLETFFIASESVRREVVEENLGVWEADSEEDLIEEITAAAGWCIKSIDYDIQLK